MIRITPRLAIDERDLVFAFVRASGPGGQNVNKVSTAVELRFDLALLPDQREELHRRIATLAGSRLTKDGVLVFDAQRFRSQERNRQDAIERLVALLREAATPPRKRIRTRPTRASKERRLGAKQQRSRIKQGRGAVRDDG